jgi:hypothetical protein
MERLRQENNILVSELASMRKLCSDLLLFIQNNVDDKGESFGSVEGLSQFLRNASDSYLFETIFAVHTLRTLKEGADMAEACHHNGHRVRRHGEKGGGGKETGGNNDGGRMEVDYGRCITGAECQISLPVQGNESKHSHAASSIARQNQSLPFSPMDKMRGYKPYDGSLSSPSLFGVSLHHRRSKKASEKEVFKLP